MSYREHLKAQKKYIQTKKEAFSLKENPPPKRLNPPPKKSLRPARVIGFPLVLILTAAFLYLLLRPLPAITKSEHFTLGINCSDSEFEELKNWLEPEILANDLPWALLHLPTREALVQNLLSNAPADLLLTEADTAQDFATQQILAPLREKEIFRPLWQTRPFFKTLGWAIPHTENAEQARHFLTVIRQFAYPFSFSCGMLTPPSPSRAWQ